MIQSKTRKLRCEPLEDRRMLSITSGVDESTAIQMFHAQDALFAENAGQWDTDDVYFGYNKGGTQIYFTDDGLEFGLSRTVDEAADPLLAESLATALEPFDENKRGQAPPLTESTHFSLSFDSATPTVPVGADQAVTKFNYHLGEQENWVDGVSTYKTVLYHDLYEGIDLHTFSLHGQMKYEFHVDPGADFTQIELSYNGIEGLSIAPDGSLHIATELGEIVDEDLYIYQTIDGQQIEIEGHFTLLDADTYTFTVTGEYDPILPFIIDPNLDWGSYLGGSNYDSAKGVNTDAAGNVYICGSTYSSGWSIAGGWDTFYGGSSDGFLVKLDNNGNHLWSTYLGGSSSDYVQGVSTDSAGNVYVCGDTESNDWAIAGGWTTSSGGYGDGFIVKLNSNGIHLWSSYLGGSGWDWATGVSTDVADNVYVCGRTGSNGFNISGGWDTSPGGGLDGYVVKLSSSGIHLWSSYLGGSSSEYAYGVSTDAANNVYVYGRTDSSNWGITGGWDSSLSGGRDGYVVKLNPSGTYLWGTYIGGSSNEQTYGLSTDAAGNVYVCGGTYSSNWSMIDDGGDTSYGGEGDSYVIKLNSSGDHLWGTYLGGSGNDFATDVSTDSAGNVYACGNTGSSDWSMAGGWDVSYGGGYYDGYVVKLNSNGTHLWETYIGGSSDDCATGVSADAFGNIYVCGEVTSNDWSIAGGSDSSYGGNGDGYIIAVNGTAEAPEASLESTAIITTSDATFSVTYSDSTDVSIATIGTGDILVTGPGGYSHYATLICVDNNTDGTPRTATYRVTSPGGEWIKDDDGTYQIAMVANQVSDTTGHFTAAGPLGTFTITAPNQLPTADAGGPYVGNVVGGTIALDASGSTDLDGNIVYYEWDLDGDGQYDDASSVIAYFDCESIGNHTVSLRVTDNDGAYDTDDVTITVLAPQTIIVNSLLDNVDVDGFVTLREAILAADTNMPYGDAPAGLPGLDLIIFDPALYANGPATITLNAALPALPEIVDDLDIQGPGQDRLTIDANGNESIFSCSAMDGMIAVSIHDLTLTGTSSISSSGGAITNYLGEVLVSGCLIANNDAKGIDNVFGTMTVCDSVISGNYRGIANNNVSVMTVINCMIAGNDGDRSGGGILNSGDLTLINSTLSGNWARERGGGIYCVGTDSVTTLNNTIVTGNTAPSGPDIFCDLNYGTLSGSHNLIGDGAGQTTLVDGVDGNQIGTYNAPLDPEFVDPDNGNYRLTVGSPAIDAGDNSLVPNGVIADLDGNYRIADGTVDIGAYEFGAGPVVAGDANGDGKVDGSDVTILAGNWQHGVTGTPNATWSMGDFNGDGKVDGSDVTILAGNWQAGVSAAVVAVSEPEPEAKPTRRFVPPVDVGLGVATVPRQESLSSRRFITPSPEAADVVLAEAGWSEADITAIAKELVAASAKKTRTVGQGLP